MDKAITIDNAPGIGIIISYNFDDYCKLDIVKNLELVQETDDILSSGNAILEVHIDIGKIVIDLNEPKAQKTFGTELDNKKSLLIKNIISKLKESAKR